MMFEEMTDEDIKDYWRAAYCNEKHKVEELEKENADSIKKIFRLVKINKKLKEENAEAKELLAKWVELFKPKGGNMPPTPIQIKTEKFLKELDKC